MNEDLDKNSRERIVAFAVRVLTEVQGEVASATNGSNFFHGDMAPYKLHSLLDDRLLRVHSMLEYLVHQDGIQYLDNELIKSITNECSSLRACFSNFYNVSDLLNAQVVVPIITDLILNLDRVASYYASVASSRLIGIDSPSNSFAIDRALQTARNTLSDIESAETRVQERIEQLESVSAAVDKITTDIGLKFKKQTTSNRILQFGSGVITFALCAILYEVLHRFYNDLSDVRLVYSTSYAIGVSVMRILCASALVSFIYAMFCIFRRKSATYSKRSRPPIPTEIGHRIRPKSATLADES